MMAAFDPRELHGQLVSECYREPGEREREAVDRAVDNLGGSAYTRRDATRVLLALRGPDRHRWRQSFALKLAVRGVL